MTSKGNDLSYSNAPRIFGLVLAGGQSRRMGTDKARINYRGQPHAAFCYDLLNQYCEKTYLSLRASNAPQFGDYPRIFDQFDDAGPLSGILSAFEKHSDCAWLVLACDLPFVESSVISNLIAERDPAQMATAYKSENNRLPEPLCAIYEPKIRDSLLAAHSGGKNCPRKILMESPAKLISLVDSRSLSNANSPEDYAQAMSIIQSDLSLKTIRIRYFASMKDAAGKSTEELQTNAATAEDLYAEIDRHYNFPLKSSLVKVSINGAFAARDASLKSGDEIVFIPPVAGG